MFDQCLDRIDKKWALLALTLNGYLGSDIFFRKKIKMTFKFFSLSLQTVTSISVIDTQSTSFSSRNQTSFPSSASSSSSSSSGNATSSSSSSSFTGTSTTTPPNRVNQQSKKSTVTSTISPNNNNNINGNNNNNNLLNDWTDSIRLPHEAIRQLRTTPTKEEQRSLAKVVFYAYKNLHQLLSDADQQLTNLEALEGEHLV